MFTRKKPEKEDELSVPLLESHQDNIDLDVAEEIEHEAKHSKESEILVVEEELAHQELEQKKSQEAFRLLDLPEDAQLLIASFLTDEDYANLRATSYVLHGPVNPQYRLQYACCFYECVTHYADRQLQVQRELCETVHRDSDGDECAECCVQSCICLCCILDLPVTVATQILRWPILASGTCIAYSCGSCFDAQLALQDCIRDRETQLLPPRQQTMI